MLAHVAAMHRSALPAIDWESQADSHRSALLSRGTFVSEGISEPLQLSLIGTFTCFSVQYRVIAPLKPFLASSTYKDSRIISVAPLVLTWLLSWMLLPLLSRGIFVIESALLSKLKILTSLPLPHLSCS